MQRCNLRSWKGLGLACVILAAACSSPPAPGVSHDAGGGMTSGGAGSSGRPGSSGGSGSSGSAGSASNTAGTDTGVLAGGGAAPATGAGFCDPNRIYAAVIEDERAKFTWPDQYLRGKVAIYQGRWLAEGTVSGNGIGDVPLSSRVESTSAIGTLAPTDGFGWRDEAGTITALSGASLRLMDTASSQQSQLQLVQPSAGHDSTYLDFQAYTSNFMVYQAHCAGCVADLQVRPQTLVAQETFFTQTSAGQIQDVTLNLDLALVSPAELTGKILITLAADRVWWSLESGEWIERGGGRYREPGLGPRGAANYSFEYFIDDAHPSQYGVRGFRVEACEEQCQPPEHEGDTCP